MPPSLALYTIVALLALIIGLACGIFLGARLTRGHYLYMAHMQQPQETRRQTRQLSPRERGYY